MKLTYYLLILFFYLVYFSKQIYSRKQGITTNQLGKGTKPKINLLIERLLLILSLSMGVAQFIIPFFVKINISFITVLGLLFIFLADIIFLLAVVKMNKNWRAGIDFETSTHLVTTGIYSYSRNPAFFAFILLYWGSCLALGNWLTLLLASFGTIIFHQQVLLEEDYLKTVFAQGYHDYCLTTSRYFSLSKKV